MNSRIINNTTMKFQGEKFKEALDACEMTQTEIAARLGITPAAVSKFISNHSKPSVETLENISKELNKPWEFFIAPEDLHFDLGRPFFRSFSSATKRSRVSCWIKSKWLNKVTTYFEEYIDFPALNLPSAESILCRSSSNADYIEHMAQLCRRAWGLSDGPISNLLAIIEDNGIIVSRFAFDSDRIDAFSVWCNDRPFIILGSNKHCAVRSRFDAAHELGHIILHKHLQVDESIDREQHKRIEDEANRFASAFLMPEQTFIEEVFSIRLDHFIPLKSRWKVSISAMIRRCRDLGIISDDHYLYLNKEISRKQWRKSEPLDYELQPEEPVVLKKALQLILENELESVEELCRNLAMSPSEIERFCFLPEGELLKIANSLKDINVNLKLIK